MEAFFRPGGPAVVAWLYQVGLMQVLLRCTIQAIA